MNQAKRQQLFEALSQSISNPSTELNYNCDFELLIAVILSAQATDISVNKATEKLFKVANTPKALLELGVEGLKSHIMSIGLFNTKAHNIIKTCKQLLDLHQGQVPNKRQQLESLPGVGRKTANVILNTLFGEPVIAVDTHIFRLSNRTKLAVGKTVLAVEQKLIKVVPKEFLKDGHHLLILHGRYVCTARKPKCNICKIFEFCEFKEKGLD